MTKAATSKIRSRSPTADLSTNSANSIEATPLGPNQAMKARCAEGNRTLSIEIATATGLRDQQREGGEQQQQGDVAAVAGGDDQGAEEEEGQHRQDRAQVLGEDLEVVGDVVLDRAQGDAAGEGGDEAVAEGDVGEAEGEHADAQRVDAVVAPRHAPHRQVTG